MMEDYLNDYKEFRSIILENPNLKIVFLTSEECGSLDFSWSMANANAKIMDVFDAETEFNDDDRVYTDKDDLEVSLYEYLVDNYDGQSEVVFDELLQSKLREYEPMWKKAIVVWIRPY